jgi:hypothetical protein
MTIRRSSSAWRQRVVDEHAVPVEDSKDPQLDDLGWERLERGQWLELAQTYDPGASLSEELLVRLVGDTARSSAMRLDWEGLLRPLQDAVVAGPEDDVALELCGFSKGSSVLHFRAVRRDPVELMSEEGPGVHETPLAAPARRFIDFVDAVEHEQDLRMYSNTAVLVGVEKLSEELSKLNLVADFRFYSRGGDVRGAQLTSRGMAYVRTLNEAEETVTAMFINGRITELRESGHAKVKQGVARNSPAYDVHFETQTLTGMRLFLGQSVNWEVSVISETDKLGRVQSTRYEFRKDAGRSEQATLNLPGFEGPRLGDEDNWPTVT